MNIIFIGAGGHAKVVYDVIHSCTNTASFHFIDENVNEFFGAVKITDIQLKELGNRTSMALAIGGVTPEALAKRVRIYMHYHAAGYLFPVFSHQSSIISDSASLAQGVVICPRAVVNAHARIGSCAIINTGAIVEHDVIIGTGAHICPGAIVLGGAHVGENSLIGAGAVVLPGARVPDNFLLPAGTRYPAKSGATQ